jgi:hypothetical protein
MWAASSRAQRLLISQVVQARFVVNLRTAKALGITVPSAVSHRDEVAGQRGHSRVVPPRVALGRAAVAFLPSILSDKRVAREPRVLLHAPRLSRLRPLDARRGRRPVGLAPTFLAVTSGLPNEARGQVALRAPAIAGAILAGTALIGDWLLRPLGISLPAFRT